MDSNTAYETASEVLKAEADFLMDYLKSTGGLPPRVKKAISNEIDRLANALGGLKDAHLNFNGVTRELRECQEQINNLGKLTGTDGMSAMHVVSETVSYIEQLRRESKRVALEI